MKKYERINRAFELKYFDKVNSSLKDKVNEVISDLENGRDPISRLHSEVGNKTIPRVIERLYVDVGLRHATDEFRKLKTFKGFGFNAEWTAFILEYLRLHLLEKVTFMVNETLRDYLLRVLTRSITEGLGVDQTVNLLRQSSFTESQAARIVRTEVNTAANTGFLAAGNTYEYQMQKEWVAILDNRVRGVDPKDHASHKDLDGTKIDFEDDFKDPRNGDLLAHPGDPKASAASIINCRCRIVLKPKRDSRGRLIPKRQSTAVIYPGQLRRGRIITI